MSPYYFELGVYVTNNGDGSATAHFTPGQDAAEAAEAKADDEPYSEPFAESSASSVVLKLEDGRLYFENYDTDTYEKKWTELPLTVV